MLPYKLQTIALQTSHKTSYGKMGKFYDRVITLTRHLEYTKNFILLYFIGDILKIESKTLGSWINERCYLLFPLFLWHNYISSDFWGQNNIYQIQSMNFTQKIFVIWRRGSERKQSSTWRSFCYYFQYYKL